MPTDARTARAARTARTARTARIDSDHAGLAFELRLSVLRLRRRWATERHPDGELVQPPSRGRTAEVLADPGQVERRPDETERRRRDAWLALRLREVSPEREVLRCAAPLLQRLCTA